MLGQAAFVTYPPAPGSPMARPGEIYMTALPGAMSILPGANGANGHAAHPPKPPSAKAGEDPEEAEETRRRKEKEEWRRTTKDKRLFGTPDASADAKSLQDVLKYVNERRDELESEQLVDFIKNHPDIGMRSMGAAGRCIHERE